MFGMLVIQQCLQLNDYSNILIFLLAIHTIHQSYVNKREHLPRCMAL